MQAVSKVIQSLCGIPIVGGFITLALAVLPGLPALFLIQNDALAAIVFGLIVAAWTFLLQHLKIIRIMAPLIPVPFWVVGLLMAAYGLARYLNLV